MPVFSTVPLLKCPRQTLCLSFRLEVELQPMKTNMEVTRIVWSCSERRKWIFIAHITRNCHPTGMKCSSLDCHWELCLFCLSSSCVRCDHFSELLLQVGSCSDSLYCNLLIFISNWSNDLIPLMWAYRVIGQVLDPHSPGN